MIEISNKKLELSQSIYEYLTVIKNVFVQYYGEQHRDRIEERFNSVTYIGYGFPEHIKRLLNNIFEEKSSELVSDFFKENDIEDTKENVNRYFNDFGLDLTYLNNLNLYNVYSYLEKDEHSAYASKKFLNNLRKISGNDNLSLGTVECDKVIDDVLRIKNSFNDMLRRFDEFKLQYGNYINYIDECSILEKKIRDKYYFKYLDEIREYLSNKDRDLLDNRNVLDTFRASNLDCYDVLVGFNYSFSTLIDAFSSESNQILDDTDSLEWKKDSIYRDRVKFFKKKGIDLGDDYQIYANNFECLKIMPSSDFADKIISIRERLAKQERKEYIMSTSNYKEQSAIIDKLGLLDKNICYNYDNLNNGIICIDPNVRMEDGNYKLYSLLLFPMESYNETFDHFLIHEFNHLFELNLKKADKNGYEVVCGWDVCRGNFCADINSNSNGMRREFERFNEIINDMIAQEITKMMHNNGIFLLSDKNNSSLSGASYQRTRFLIQDFFDMYRQEIIDSRISGDMSKLFDKVGRDNFMRLNKLVSDYGDRFVGFEIYKMYDDLNNNVLTDDVLYFKDCVRVRDEILSDMEEVRSVSIENNVR